MANHSGASIVRVKRLFVNKQFGLGIFFDPDTEIEEKTKSLGAIWNSKFKAWILDDNEESLDQIRVVFRKLAWLDVQRINSELSEDELRKYTEIQDTINPSRSSYPKPELTQGARLKLVPIEYKETMERKRYSMHTVSSYCALFATFLYHYKKIAPVAITVEQIQAYLDFMKTKRSASDSTINQVLSAIKIYYVHVLGRDKKLYQLKRPQKEQYRIHYLSFENAARLIEAGSNLKHQCILSLMYATGMVNEDLKKTRVKDFDFKKGSVRILARHPRSSREVYLNEKLLGAIQIYIDRNQPKHLLFPSTNGKEMSSEAVERIIKSTAERAGLEKVNQWVVRKSFAHQLELNGYEPNLIQMLQGNAPISDDELGSILPYLKKGHEINVAHNAINDSIAQPNKGENFLRDSEMSEE